VLQNTPEQPTQGNLQTQKNRKSHTRAYTQESISIQHRDATPVHHNASHATMSAQQHEPQRVAAHAVELQRALAEHARELESTRDQHTHELEGTRAQHVAIVAKITAEMREAQQHFVRELERTRAQHSRELADDRAQHEAIVSKMAAELREAQVLYVARYLREYLCECSKGVTDSTPSSKTQS